MTFGTATMTPPSTKKSRDAPVRFEICAIDIPSVDYPSAISVVNLPMMESVFSQEDS